MIYSNHFVMCVLVNGKPLKERADGIVTIPVNAEYTIRFKNKNSRRAMVTFTLDGESASGNGYVIPAHQDIEIKRFADRDQMFKFVELNSDEAQLEGKNGPNWDGSKGVIEARFYLEKAYTPPPPPVYQPIPIPYPQPYPVPTPYPWPRPRTPYYGQPIWNDHTQLGGTYCSNSVGGTKSATRGMSAGGGGTMSACAMNDSGPVNSTYVGFAEAAPTLAEGVTVGGNASGQTFYTVAFDSETDYVTLKLVLRGTNEPLREVHEDAEYCSNCGAKKGKKNDKFCGKCGTKL